VVSTHLLSASGALVRALTTSGFTILPVFGSTVKATVTLHLGVGVVGALVASLDVGALVFEQVAHRLAVVVGGAHVERASRHAGTQCE